MRDWAAAQEEHTQSKGISDESVRYGNPIVGYLQGDAACLVTPTVYVYKEHGKAMTADGRITFVLHREPAAWKIRAWTWAGTVPKPAR